jgi:PAS domain S-box-containing protein
MSTEVGAATETVQVLHVDSDPAVTRQLRATVGADQQFAVVGEADERAALDSVESGTPDCVVVGHDPPETDGVAFVERLREDHPELPVVLFTANGSEQVASRAISAGVTDYVPATSAVGTTTANEETTSAEEGTTTANEETTSAEEGATTANEEATSPADGTANAEAAATATESAYHTLTERLRQICDVASTGQETAETAGQTGTTAGEHTTEQVERFAELFPGVAFVIDETGRYRDLLAGDEESLLYSDAEALVGRTFDDVLPPETAERFGGVVREVVESGQRQRIEYSLDVQAGERWFEAQVGPFTSRGELETVFWVARDITERTRRQREYEQIFHSVNDTIAVHDIETGEMLDANQRLVELTGYDEETLLELGAGELLVDSPDVDYGPEDVGEIVRRVREGEQVEPYEQVLETSDRDRVWIEVNPTRAIVGGEERFLAIARDITERKRRELEYEQLFESVNDAIGVVAPETMELVDANAAYLDLLDCDDLDEVRQRGIDGVSNTDAGFTRERAVEIHRRVADSGEPEVVEWEVRTSTGRRRWLEIKVAPAELDGREVTVAFLRDVTERKRRKQRLEVFNRVLRHNLRNQADVVDSHAEELLQRDRRGSDEESLVCEHAERIRAGSERLAGVSRRARTIDRILSEGLDTRRVDLGACLAETLDRVDRPEADVDVTTSVPEDATLASDRRLLIAVFESALDNAVTHARSRVQVEATRTTDGWQVVIDDDGGGIPQAELDVIAAGTETDLQHSRWLGLGQLKWGVEKLDGSLAFDVDDGTTVRITVPDRDVCGNS